MAENAVVPIAVPIEIFQELQEILKEIRNAPPAEAQAHTDVLSQTLVNSGRIQSVLGVFVDAREPENPKHNRREEEVLAHPVEHTQFIGDELVPLIDRTYRTDPRPEARLIAGVSFGGLSASYIAASRSDTFHNLAAFSPALWSLNSPQSLRPRAKGGLPADPACDR